MPVVISGETGCGKSSLIPCMCKVLSWSLDVLNVHSGLSHVDIASWVEQCAMTSAARDAGGDGPAVSVMLLDEINACGSVGRLYRWRREFPLKCIFFAAKEFDAKPVAYFALR